MTDRAQFEAMLEALINENHDAAKEIFHNIVVGKSREIYEELLESDFSQDQGNPYAKKDDDDMEESDDTGDTGRPQPEAPMEEGDDEEEADDAEDDEMDMDAEDDEMDMDADDEFGGEEEGGDMEDRVMDLEDALEDLKAEFEQLLAGEEAEENDHPGIHDMGGDDMSMDSEEDKLDQMMEYVNKVSPPKHGDNGANAKSIVAGKNDMGGTTGNIAKSFSTTSGGTQGGLLKPSTTLQDGGNINKPGASAGKSAFKKREPGHGAESKGKSETADKSAGSVLNGVKSRAK